MKQCIMMVFLIFLYLSFTSCSNNDTGKEEALAVEAAEKWLSLIDNEKYIESWNESAQIFQNAITEEGWAKRLETGRRTFGTKLSRKVISKKLHTSLPGAPDGQYVVVQFKSSFTNKETAIETVTPKLDKDGKWRVSGYYKWVKCWGVT